MADEADDAPDSKGIRDTGDTTVIQWKQAAPNTTGSGRGTHWRRLSKSSDVCPLLPTPRSTATSPSKTTGRGLWWRQDAWRAQLLHGRPTDTEELQQGEGCRGRQDIEGLGLLGKWLQYQCKRRCRRSAGMEMVLRDEQRTSVLGSLRLVGGSSGKDGTTLGAD